MEDRSDLIAAVAGIVLALAALYLLMARRAWLRQRLPPHPARPRPGTVPRMRRRLRTPVR